MAHTLQEIKNPGPLKVPASVNGMFIGAVVIGLIGLIIGMMMDGQRGWTALLLNHFFFLSLAIGGLFISAIQYLTSAMWSAPVRRLSESFTAYLPIVLLGFIVICIGMPHLYLWAHPEHVQGDLVLEHKQAYLNVPFFIIRGLVAIGLWFFFAKKIVGNSIAQDKDGDPHWTTRNKVLAPIFTILFAVTYTAVSIDELMSLDPHWFSTMFGVYTFAGMFTSALAMTAVFTILLRRNGMLKGVVNDNHLHDIGKFMFAFTIFWAYIAFCQFMLIWYANLPEETMYFSHRMFGGWKYVSTFLLLGKFVVPFMALLPREAKRNEGRLMWVAIWMLFAQWIDLLWLIQPEFFPGGPKIGIPEVAGFLLFGGLFGWVSTYFLSKNDVVAIKDPSLVESVFYHHQ